MLESIHRIIIQIYKFTEIISNQLASDEIRVLPNFLKGVQLDALLVRRLDSVEVEVILFGLDLERQDQLILHNILIRPNVVRVVRPRLLQLSPALSGAI